MSAALCGSSHTSAPSLTCQPGRTPVALKLCHPVKSCPLKRSFQPAAFSASVRVLLAPGAPDAARMGPNRPAAADFVFIAHVLSLVVESGRKPCKTQQGTQAGAAVTSHFTRFQAPFSLS